ncbi:hypothetical protein MCHI_002950 [Candidatus Magnetoovum chiemensis]|nr:hypothetical protein MCHI_002950 [Candidatus Magnetoovum chiemensis]
MPLRLDKATGLPLISLRVKSGASSPKFTVETALSLQHSITVQLKNANAM